MTSKIKASTATVSREDLRVVRITALRDLPKGTVAFIEMHDEPGVFRRVISSNLPAGALKTWTDEKAVLRVQGRGDVVIGNHTMKGPAFPCFERPKKTGDGTTICRLTIFIENGKFASQREIDMAKKADMPPAKRGRPVGSKNKPKEVVETVA